MTDESEPSVDIAFDCLPLRSIGRFDIPLDASTAFRQRCEHLQRSVEAHSAENAYFLYNSRCVFRLANSDIQNMLRFTFQGTLWTDRSDRQASGTDLIVELAAETCGGVSAEALAWFRRIVEQAVIIEFDRFITTGHMPATGADNGKGARLTDLASFAGMNV